MTMGIYYEYEITQYWIITKLCELLMTASATNHDNRQTRLTFKTTEIHASYFLKIFCCLTAKEKIIINKYIKKSLHCYENRRVTLNRYEHLIKCLLKRFNLTHSHPNENVTFEGLVICKVKSINRSNDFICWSSRFSNTSYTVTTRINFDNSTHWPMRLRKVFHLLNNQISTLKVSSSK